MLNAKYQAIVTIIDNFSALLFNLVLGVHKILSNYQYPSVSQWDQTWLKIPLPLILMTCVNCLKIHTQTRQRYLLKVVNFCNQDNIHPESVKNCGIISEEMRKENKNRKKICKENSTQLSE